MNAPSSSDTASAAFLPFDRNIGMSTRPMMIRSTTGLNCIFPISFFFDSFRKRHARRVSRRILKKKSSSK